MTTETPASAKASNSMTVETMGVPETNLPAIDETKPSCLEQQQQQQCLDLDLDVEKTKEDEFGEGKTTSGATSQCNKKCMKDRLRGLANKYVSCLQALDGAGDMRGYADGGPTMVPGSQPFEPPSSPFSD